MSKNRGALIALSALLSSMAMAGCSTQDSEKGGANAGQISENTGSMGLNLTLSNGVVINAVTATVTGSALASPVIRSIPVPNQGATVSALFGGLPAGAYSIDLSADSEDGASHCGGTAAFTVLAGQTVGVTVPMTCNTDSVRGTVTVNGELNTCPDVDFLFVAPLQTAVGGPIAVEANASDADGNAVTFAWTATNGSFAAADAASTTYTCSAPGDQTLTVTINDGGNCATTHQVDVRCEPTAVCGDGDAETDKGEQCDPPDGVLCDANCQTISVSCGNSILQGTEECDPPNGVTCNATCELITCGDGVLEGTEQCEAPFGGPGAGNCNSDCTRLPSVCGNNIEEPGEECEPPGTAACDANCQDSGASACEVCQASSCPGPLADLAARCTGTTCDAYLACQASTGCDDGGDMRDCYCGSVDPATCFNSFDANVPQGPCKTEIAALAGTTIPLQVGTQWFDSASYPLGAIGQYNLCTGNNCSAECY